MNKMAKNLAVANESSKGTSQAIAALGLNLDDFKKMKPEDQLQAVAASMGDFADGSGKTAIAMTLFGKAGAQMLPFMRDLAETGTLQAKVTAEQAAQAEAFDRGLMKVKVSSEAWKKELAMGMLPALNEGVQAFLAVTNGAGGLRDQVRQMDADGTIAEWTRNAITGLTYVSDAVTYLWRTLKVVGDGWGAMFASMGAGLGGVVSAIVQFIKGDYAGAWNSLKTGAQQSATVVAEFGKTTAQTFGDSTLGSQMRARMADFKGMTVAVKDTRDALNFSDSGTGKVDPQVQAYATLVAAIKAKTEAFDLETDSGRKLMESEKTQIEIDKLVEKGTISKAQAESLNTKALLDSMAASETAKMVRESEYKNALEIAQARQKLRNQEYDDAKKLMEQAAVDENKRTEWAARSLEQIQFETSLLTMNTQQRELAIVMRDAEKNGLQKGADAWKAYAASMGIAITSRDAVQKSIDDFKAIWTSVDKTAHDVFVNIFMGGQNVFQKLRDTLKATLLDLLYQMTVKKWIFDITASVTGTNAGVAGAVAQGTSGLMTNGLSSTMSSVATVGGQVLTGGMSLANAGGTIAATMAGTGIDGLLATNAAYGTAAAGSAVAGAGGITSALAAIPGWGWAALGVAAVAAVLSSSHGGPKVSGSAGVWTGSDPNSNALDGNMQTLVATTTAQYQSIAALLGNKTAQAQFGFYASTDPQGKSSTLLGNNAAVNGQQVYSNFNTNVGRSDAELQAALTEASTRAVVAALKATTFDANITEFLSHLDAASGDVKTLSLALDTLSKSRQASATLDALGVTLTHFSELNIDGQAALLNQFGGLTQMQTALSHFQQTYMSQGEQIAATTAALSKEFASLGVAMPATRDEFKQLVQSFDITTVAGQAAFVQLLSMGDAFGTVADAAAAAAKAAADQAAATAAATAGAQAQADAQASADAQAAAQAAAQKAAADAAAAQANLTSNTTSYLQTYYTQAEQTAKQTAVLADQFKALGIAMPSSKDEFRALVDSLNLGTDAGKATYAMLMSMAAAFATVADASSAAATAATQKAAADAAAATQKAAAELQAAQSVMNTASSNLVNAYKTQSSAMQSTIDKLRAFTDSMRTFRDGLLVGSLSTLSPEQQYDVARQQAQDAIAKAKGGDPTAQSQVQGFISTFLNASKAYNASGKAYGADFQWAQQALTDLANTSASSADVQQLQLDALTSQVSQLVNLNATTLSVRDAIDALAAAQAAYVKAGGTVTTTGMNNALTTNQLYGAGGILAPAMSTADLVKSWYANTAGASTPDQAGIDYWVSQLSNPNIGQNAVAGDFSRTVAAINSQKPSSGSAEVVNQLSQVVTQTQATVSVLSAGLQQLIDVNQATTDSVDTLARNAAMEAARP